MDAPLFQVDAFTDQPFTGNPAAVCLLPEPQPANWMQAVAAEMNLSETAFLVQEGDGYRLRWFTPKVEVDLCGHATLASAHVLWTEGRVSFDKTINFRTNSGVLKAVRRGDLIELDFPLDPPSAASPPPELLPALGVVAKYFAKGKFDYLVEVGSEEIVRSMKPVGIDLTPEHFREISLRRGESTFHLAVERGIPNEEIACLRTERDRLYSELLGARSWVIQGVEDVLRSLYGKVQMGIVTSSRRDHFDIAHAKSGLLRYFDFVLTREDYEHTKPHPEPYLTAMRRHRLVPERCIVIEDSERGLASARAAELECLIVLSEWTKDGNFSQACRVLESIVCVPDEVLRRASHHQESQERKPP